MPYVRKSSKSKASGKTKKSSYSRKTGTTTVKALVRRVKRIEVLDKPEVKRIYNFLTTRGAPDTPANQNLIGQVNGVNNGYFSLDVTPLLGSGTGTGQRVGAMIRVKNMYFRFMFKASTTNNVPIMGKIIFFQPKVQQLVSPSVTTAFQSMMNPNPFITNISGGLNSNIFDYSSFRNIDTMANFKIIKIKTFKIPSTEFTSQQNKFIPVNVNLTFGKYGNVVRYIGDSSTVSHGLIYMCIVTDAGNIDPVNDNTTFNGLNLPLKLGGISMVFSDEIHYTDA